MSRTFRLTSNGCSGAMAAMASSLQIPKMARSIPQFPSRTQQTPRMPVTTFQLSQSSNADESQLVGRRQALTILSIGLVELNSAGSALADALDDYKSETEAVIARVRETLAMDKTDPGKADAVASLRQSSNDWVAKYRREKRVAGKPSFSNMYSVLNAISGHYISFGPSSAIPAKRQQRILEEMKDAEKALGRGR